MTAPVRCGIARPRLPGAEHKRIGAAPLGQKAADLRRRFCTLVAARGLAENYDALTGAPLRDCAFTWTASAFLLLAAELAQPGQTERLARQ